MKKIAIMGANGFVGRNLTSYLSDKYKIYPITRQQIDLLDSSKVKAFLQEHIFDVIINCANQGGSRKTGYDVNKSNVIGDNLRMFFNMERCLLPSTKFINFGSGAQYNKQRDLAKISETEFDQVIPTDDYGYSKYVMSKYIKAKKASNIYNPVIFGLYGWYEDYSFKFISNAIIKNLLHMPIIINQNVVFDYLFIEDFLKIIEMNVEEDFLHKEYNITPIKSIDLITICEIINICGDYNSEIIVRNTGYNFQYTGDNQLLLENIGNVEKDFTFTSYESGIRKLYEYYRKHLSKIDVESVKQDTLLKYCRTK